MLAHTLGPGPVWKHATRPGLAGHAAAAAGSCCGQLLRRAAETPEHLAQVVVPGRKSDWS